MRSRAVIATSSYAVYLTIPIVNGYEKLQNQTDTELLSPTRAPQQDQFYSRKEFDSLVSDMKDSINSFWIITAAANIVLMQMGFAFVEVGSIHRKNTTNILYKNLVDTFCGAMGFYAFGFAFANFANGGLSGNGSFFCVNLERE